LKIVTYCLLCMNLWMHSSTPSSVIITRVAIWPFLKQFSSNKMIWPFGLFLAFFKSWRKPYLLRPILAKFQQNMQHFMIFKIYTIYIGKFSVRIWPLFAFFWPFSRFENLAFFEAAYGLGPGNPDNYPKVTHWKFFSIFFWPFY
jgi:hypothetical protein